MAETGIYGIVVKSEPAPVFIADDGPYEVRMWVSELTFGGDINSNVRVHMGDIERTHTEGGDVPVNVILKKVLAQGERIFAVSNKESRLNLSVTRLG